MSLVVNLISGPSSGKSTLAFGLMYMLKSYGFSCEYTGEFAKDLTYEKRIKTFENQVYIFAKQYQRIFRLLDTVDIVVTDSPILLSLIYQTEELRQTAFSQMVLETHNQLKNLNFFVQRRKDVAFEEKARMHNEEQAIEIDNKILAMFAEHNIGYDVVRSNEMYLDLMYGRVINELG